MKNKILIIVLIGILGCGLLVLTGCQENQNNEIEQGKNTNKTGVNQIEEQGKDILESTTNQLEKNELQSFNSQFEKYQGNSIEGTKVRTLFAAVNANNRINSSKTVKITGDLKKSSDLDTEKKYTVKCQKDSSGRINEINIIEE